MLDTIITPAGNQATGGGQARRLRALVAHRNASQQPSRQPGRRCQTIVVSGGKGGVGRSIIALNLAVILAQRGEAVGLLDACPDLGNIGLLCGLNGYWNLSHVLQGCRQLSDILQTGPAGVKILSGASCLTDRTSGRSTPSSLVIDQLQTFEQSLDWLIVDGSGGASALTREFTIACDDCLIVATPEPTAIAEAYATVKSLASAVGPRLGLLVNQADSVAQSQQILDTLQQAAHSFLQVDLHRRGSVPRDAAIPNSVVQRTPFVIQSPQSPASLALLNLTQRWTRRQPPADSTSFFSRLGQSK